MTDGLPNHERDLNQRLDRAVPPHTRASGPADDDPLVRAAQRLASGPDVSLSGAAFDRIEARLRAKLEAPAIPQQPVRAPAAPVRRRKPVVFALLRYAAAVMVVVLGFLTLNQASAASLPGDRLYPVKRAIEGVRVAVVAQDDEAALRLSLAERRVDEFEALLERGRVYPDTLQQAEHELHRALDLLAAGHGDWRDAEPQLRSVTAREMDLLDQAMLYADATAMVRLETQAVAVAQVQERITTLSQIFVPDSTTPTEAAMLPTAASPTPTVTPSPTVTATASATATATMTPAATASSTATPTATMTPSATASATTTPTLTITAPPAPCLFTVAFSSISLRTGPGTGYTVIGFGYADDVFTVITQDATGTWYELQAESDTVWVANSTGVLSGDCDDLLVSDEAYLGTTSDQPDDGGTASDDGSGTASDDGGTTSDDGTTSDKITICHKGTTIVINVSALDAHLTHGDTIGACPE